MEDMLYKACKKLRLGSNIVDNAKSIEKSNHIEFLLELFTLGLEHREMKRRNMYVKQAKFDMMKTFEDIKVSKSITPDEIISSTFIDKKEISYFMETWEAAKLILQ